MALFDILKRKKPAQSKALGRARQNAELLAGKKPVEPAPAMSRPKNISGIAYKILKKPHVTEKAGDLTSKNQYVFEVLPRANKTEIKKAIEEVYGVDVQRVQIVNIPKKRRIFQGIDGWRGGYKKAVVKIKKGQKIEVLPR